ncbi:MAG: rhomboid family intramembrane serine protease [Opitutaceae bacterium]|jgi:hypothetical protein|nr:rhomboid family intramembrane serine protease [Opitutaceae bacterium]
MSWLHRIERRLEPFAIRNITVCIVAGQALLLVASLLGIIHYEDLFFIPARAINGEWWRFVTLVFLPPFAASNLDIVFAAFALYLLFMFGTALESQWSALRYNLFLLAGYALTVGLAFVTPGYPATNTFIAGSIFLAFAFLFPDFVLSLFFILPVKIKWIALFTWLMYGYGFVTGGLATRLAIIASVGNFLLFFARDIWQNIRRGRRRLAEQSRRIVTAGEPRHRCRVCGKTDLTDPLEDFRYCSKCAGDQCYCSAHIRDHEHIVAEPPAKS